MTITIHAYYIHVFPSPLYPHYFNLCTVMFGRSLAWGAAADGPEVDTRVRVRANKLDTIVLPGERLQWLQQINRHTDRHSHTFCTKVILARQIWCNNFDIVHIHVCILYYRISFELHA